MATATPTQLNRFLRRGKVPTQTVRVAEHVMTGLDDQVGDDTSTGEDEDPMATLAATLGPEVCSVPVEGAPPASTNPASTHPEVTTPRRTGAGSRAARYGGAAPTEAAAQEVAPPQPAAAEPSQDPAPDLQVPLQRPPASRAARFGAPVPDPLERAAVARPSPVKVGPAPAGGAATPGAPRAWERISTEVVGARQAMSAAKVVAPLVAAVSFNPGAAAQKRELSKALSTMLVAVHQGATAVAEHWSAVRGKDVPAWLVSQLMQSYAEIVARRWESTGTADIEKMTAEMCQLLTNEDGEVARMLLEASDQAYVEATTADVAANRIAASAIAAGWQLWDWVRHDLLLLGENVSERPASYYSYEQDLPVVVDKLLRMCLSVCRSMPLNVDHADTRVAHMQASIRRMANLVGAEYVSQTRYVLQWIKELEPFTPEWGDRRRKAAADFEARILPHICEWARQNFVRVEQGAFGAVEELLNDKPTTPAVGSGAADRPVRQ